MKLRSVFQDTYAFLHCANLFDFLYWKLTETFFEIWSPILSQPLKRALHIIRLSRNYYCVYMFMYSMA